MLRLRCKVQQYAWGKPGATSKVAELQVRDVQQEHVKCVGMPAAGRRRRR